MVVSGHRLEVGALSTQIKLAFVLSFNMVLWDYESTEGIWDYLYDDLSGVKRGAC